LFKEGVIENKSSKIRFKFKGRCGGGREQCQNLALQAAAVDA
jgi:hypothetical protein